MLRSVLRQNQATDVKQRAESALVMQEDEFLDKSNGFLGSLIAVTVDK